MTADRPLLGIALMTGFCVMAPLGDAMAKILGGRLPVLELVTIRFAVQAAILAPMMLAAGHGLTLSPRALRLTALRTALHVAGIAAMYLALQHLPLAEAVAIAFVMPFILLLLGHLILGEEVGTRRLLACMAGFAGTLMVLRPTFAEAGAAALLPLCVAVIFALFMLVTRAVARDAGPLALQAVSGLLATALLLPLLALTAALPGAPAPVLPSGGDLALVLALGALGTLAHLAMTWSLRFAPSATLAPMQYLEIPFATLFGWMIFRDLPDGLAAAGILVTVAAGLYIIAREHTLSRRPAPPAPHASPPGAG